MDGLEKKIASEKLSTPHLIGLGVSFLAGSGIISYIISQAFEVISSDSHFSDILDYAVLAPPIVSVGILATGGTLALSEAYKNLK